MQAKAATGRIGQLGYWLAIIALAGCARPSSDADIGTRPDAARPEVAKTLTLAALRPIEAFGPWDPSGNGGTFSMHNIHSSSLITTDTQGAYLPRLLGVLPSFDDGTMAILPDGRLQTTWRVRPDIKWHDGVSFSADDLAFTWQVLADPEIPLRASVQVQQMLRVEAVDSHTAVVTWKTTFFQSLYLGLREFWPFPKHILGDAYMADKKAFVNLPYWSTEFVNTGPYRLTDFGPGDRLTFERFEDYFLGRPKIATIILRIFADPNVAFANLLSGELDILSENALPFELYTQLRDSWKQTGQGTVVERQANWRFFAPQFNPEWGRPPEPISQRCFMYGIPDFTPADYEHLCRAYLPDQAASSLDCAKIHRFAPKLNAHQLKTSCEWLAREDDLDTERFVDYLRSQRMTSNVNIGEVQSVDLSDLKGIDDVVQALEANIVLPLESDELAAELGITPKRGVLLAGPPGTGKTTIGRALAHRLQSKFFLIDGTAISGTNEFYGRIREVFQAAKDNAPSIVFIDDSDVIFESGEELGLYRYLLTTLDGLESESAARVAVMMTAMNVASLPPALVRSGRIELWLETRLPDSDAREAILRAQLVGLPASLAGTDIEQLVAATDGFTGADMKRLVEDGKLLFAYDKARHLPARPTTSYFLDAATTVRANKERYATAEAQARHQRPGRPPYYDISDQSLPSL
jgi:transitional endoplasmic reticulum ATPase